MPKSKVLKVFSTFLVVLLAVFVFTSCAAPAAAPAEQKSMPVIKAVPDTGAPSAKVDYYGANFEPGQKVWASVLDHPVPDMPPIEQVFTSKNIVVGTPAERGMVMTDAVGSFHINKIKLPKAEGVWPVSVYNENGEMIAATAVVVKKPAEK
ncbi:hypothetical protein ACFLUZ_05580 [Chloroflexota bacterium]